MSVKAIKCKDCGNSYCGHCYKRCPCKEKEHREELEKAQRYRGIHGKLG